MQARFTVTRIEGDDLGHAVEIDDGAAVHTLESQRQQALVDACHCFSQRIHTIADVQVDVVAARFDPVDLVDAHEKLAAEFLDEEAIRNPGRGSLVLRLIEKARFALQSPQHEAIEVDDHDNQEVGAEILEVLIAEFSEPVLPVVGPETG